ncbi:MAG: glycoside hydrolase family 88 protein [Chloroflexi bacterium]|nr:glycoside hydrolase family 88 protein [Chloroflexota bacterium]
MNNLSILLADTILTRYPDPDSIPYRPWCYVQGYVLAGLEKLWQYTGNPAYFAYIRKFVDQHVTPDGSLSGFAGDSLDDMLAGTMIVAVYQHTGEEKYRLAAQHIRQTFEDYPRNSDGGFWHARALLHQMWIDGVFMGGMFLARYGAVIGERQACFDEVTRQILILASHCRKAGLGLFLHAYDESRRAAWADPLTGLSPEVWSEGLGWYALVLVETLDLMPPADPNRAPVMQVLLGLAEGLRQAQDTRSGLWYQVVDRGQRPDNWHDTSGSAMFTYALQRAIDLGYVSPAIFTPVVQQAYAGLLTKVVIDPQGLVDIYAACDGVCVQPSYADYINYPRAVNAKEAVGSFLWSAVAVEKPGWSSF